MSKYEKLWEYIAAQEQTSITLTFDEAAEIAGVPLGHSFLTYKKELTGFGWQVGKISMKAKTVSFARSE